MRSNSSIVVIRDGFTPELYTTNKLNELIAQKNVLVVKRDSYGQPTVIIVQEVAGAETLIVDYR